MKFLITVQIKKLSDIFIEKVSKTIDKKITKVNQTSLRLTQICSSYSNTSKNDIHLYSVTFVSLDRWGYTRSKTTEAKIDLPLQKATSQEPPKISKLFQSKRKQFFQNEGVNAYILKTYERQRKLISFEEATANNEVQNYEQLTLF